MGNGREETVWRTIINKCKTKFLEIKKGNRES